MKFLEDHLETKKALQQWSKRSLLVKSSFYFWHSGSELQKSLLGLLQSLLYHVLSVCPNLVSVIFPDRWNRNDDFSPSDAVWSDQELHRAFEKLKTQTSIGAKFYFHVDGLDEYEGDPSDVIDIIEDLSLSPHFKFCVSSRPWNEFEYAFGQKGSQLLRLHELTREDIELFTWDTLLSYRVYTENSNKDLLAGLVLEIVDRAQGVFLWVRLVLQNLRVSLVNQDSAEILLERLKTLPIGLKKLFKHILNSVDSFYHPYMARTFLTAIEAKEPLKMIHYAFLEETDLSFGFELDFVRLSESEQYEKVLRTQKQLNGRYMGLLEPSTTLISNQTTVDFLHRTLRDFLATARMREYLQLLEPSSEFDARLAICRIYLAEAKRTTQSLSLKDFELAAQVAALISKESGDSFYEFLVLDHIELVIGQDWPAHLRCSSYHNMLSIAAHLGRLDYVQHRIKKASDPIDMNCLLMHTSVCYPRTGGTISSVLRADFDPEKDGFCAAIVPFDRLPTFVVSSGQGEWNPAYNEKTSVGCLKPAMVQGLFELGADPNSVGGGIQIWNTFLQNLIAHPNTLKEEAWRDVLLLFIQNGASINDYTDCWSKILTMRYEPGEELYCVRLFELLFRRGLKASTIFTTLLDTLTISRPDKTSNDHTKSLIQFFLRHGADAAQISNINNEMITDMMCYMEKGKDLAVLDSHISKLEVFFKYALDPNAPFQGDSSNRTL